MSNVKSSKRKSLGLSTVLLMGGALLATGAVAPAANAATPERAPIAATQIHEGNLQNVSVGTYLRVENKSNQPITVQLSGNYKVNNVVQPGGHVDCKGNGSDDDVNGRITFADGTSLPIYANNPTFAECYALEMDPGSEPGMTSQEFSNCRNSNPMLPSTVASKSNINQMPEILK